MTVVGPASAAWTEHVVDSFFDASTAVRAADVDGDGDLDVVGSAWDVDLVAWFENVDGEGTGWVEHPIDSSYDKAWCARPADVDGDGDVDVLGAAVTDSDVSWWENLDGDGLTWVEHLVDGEATETRSVHAEDIDGDGDLDIVGEHGGQVLWYENVDGSGTVWTELAVGDGNWYVYSEDVNGDGASDILAIRRSDDHVLWWDNVNGDGTVWVENVVAAGFDAYSLHAEDLDGDGDADVLAPNEPLDNVTWWENTDGTGTLWTEHLIAGGFNSARRVWAADLDVDGDIDVIGAGRDGIAVWDNLDGDGSSWRELTLDAGFDVAETVHAADINGDGKVDILAGASFPDDMVSWWESPGPLTLGGEVRGLTMERLVCRNVTTGQEVILIPPGGVQPQIKRWDCEDSGLTVSPGDEVVMEQHGFREE